MFSAVSLARMRPRRSPGISLVGASTSQSRSCKGEPEKSGSPSLGKEVGAIDAASTHGQPTPDSSSVCVAGGIRLRMPAWAGIVARCAWGVLALQALTSVLHDGLSGALQGCADGVAALQRRYRSSQEGGAVGSSHQIRAASSLGSLDGMIALHWGAWSIVAQHSPPVRGVAQPVHGST